jgi:myo-inositol 2-dehydrogenase/D-chiro-inositol 1-dehydrogenase
VARQLTTAKIEMAGNELKRPLGVAMFGFGRIGNIHSRNILSSPRMKLQWIIEEEPSIAQQFLIDHHITTTKVIRANEANKALEDPDVDFVVIGTPTDTHGRLVMASLKAKKAVMCEKPLASTVDEVNACYDEAEKAGRPLLCAFQRRFDPTLSSIQKRTQQGEIGKIHVIKSCSRDSQTPSQEYVRSSGGIFWDSTVHDFDMVCWLAGETPSTVYASGHAFIPFIKEAGDVDTVVVTLKFPSGKIGIIDQSRHAVYGYDQRLEVFGENGMLVAENKQPTTTIYSNAAGIHEDRIEDSFQVRYLQAYQRELEHFADVVEGKADLLHKHKDTLLTMQLAAACNESHRQGKVIDFNASEYAKEL